MATCKQTAYELIQDVFSPCVSVLCSSDVEQICAKNNLSFVQMVQPFCRLNTEATIRDPNNMPSPIRNFRVVMKHLESLPPSPTIGKKMMHDAVASTITTSSDSLLSNTLETDNYFIKYCSSTPWFEAFRDVFFQVTSSPEHEFIHNFISCVIVVSSSHQDPLSQINELSQQFTQYQNAHSSRWFFPTVFTYYLLLHDVSSEDLGKAEAIYQSMKSSFGATVCHLLQINSTDLNHVNSDKEINDNVMPDPWSQFLPKYCIQNNIVTNNSNTEENHVPSEEDKSEFSDVQKDSNFIHHPLLYNMEPNAHDDSMRNSNENIVFPSSYSNKYTKNTTSKRHGECLTLSDLDRIKCFIQDFCIQGLIPFVEKRIRTLNEQVANRKGIHRTLFGVTKKFFGNKPGAQSPSATMNSVVYGPDAPELQVRKLGDIAFIFQLYELAYQAYHNAKRDFSADQAWLHFAGASEMAALSVFMQNNPAQEFPVRYIESAITTYLHTCKLPDLATRATLLSTECLKAKGMYNEAAAQFVRLPSEADLHSALCLEQAAFCYINCSPAKIRKYAFHIILAGHRFSKAGQRKHALRSYKQAEQVYHSVGWYFAKNHINFTIGRISVQLNQLESACSAFEPLLVSKCQLPPVDQANYLKEYLFVLRKLVSQKSTTDLPILPVPLVISECTKVLLEEDTPVDESGPLYIKGRGFDRGDINNSIWGKLEELVVTHATNNPIFYNQLQCFTSRTDNAIKPNTIVGEVISVEILVRNPLSIDLMIDDVYPLWIFIPRVDGTSSDSTPIKNEPGVQQLRPLHDIIETRVLPRVMLESQQEKKLHLLLIPKQVGELSIIGLSYSILSINPQEYDGSVDVLHNPESVISLQGKQLFHIKGPRLNKTTEERASKVYAEDNRLNINVWSSMPKLQVKFETFPYHLFCGEIHKTTAEFTNIGPHNLRRIIITSPTPGIFAIGNPGDVGDRHSLLKEISSSRQTSPVMAKWDTNWFVEILTPDGDSCELLTGQSVKVPIWFKGPDIPGDHDLDLLFYYESEPAHPKLKYRLLQLSTVLITYPSLCFQSNAMRSLKPEGKLSTFHPAAIPSSLMLCLEAANVSEELHQVSLIQLSCISQQWCLPSNFNVSKGTSVIHSNETLMLTFKAIGFDVKSSASSQQIKVFSHIPIGRAEVDISSSPCLDFSQKSGIDLISLMSSDDSKIALPNVHDNSKKNQDAILLLALIWKAKVDRAGNDEVVIGLHYIPIHTLEETTDSKPPSIEAEDILIESEATTGKPLINVPSDLAVTSLLSCSLDYELHVNHDFKTKRILTVPIEFIACSICDTEITIIVDDSMNQDSTLPTINSDDCSQATQHFSWVNGSKKSLVLRPHSTVRIPLKAMFCEPGTYYLSCLNISVIVSQDIVTIYPLSPYLMIVGQSDKT